MRPMMGHALVAVNAVGKAILIILSAFLINGIALAMFPFLWHEAFYLGGFSFRYASLTFGALLVVGYKLSNWK